MLKKYGLILFISVVLCILQQAIFSCITFFGFSVDIVFVFIICFSLLMEDIDSVILALLCGLIRDSFFPYIFGLNTILYIFIAFSISHINKRIYKDTVIIPIMVTVSSTALKGIIYFSYLYISSIKFDFSEVVDGMLYEACLNAFACVFIYRIAKKITKIKVIQQEWKF